MKRALYIVGGIASLACAWFFGRALLLHWNAVSSLQWNGGVLRASAIALLLYASTYAIGAFVWQQCLRVLGQRLPLARAATVLAISQLAKYLPGNVGHHVGRVAMARNAGIATDRAVASVVLETLLVVMAGMLCSTPAVALLQTVAAHRFPGLAQRWPHLLWLGAGVAVVVAAVLGAWVWKRQSYRTTALARPLLSMALSFAGLCLSFALGGSALHVLCAVLEPQSGLPWFAVVGIYSAAWLGGFLIPGSPAGLGVREFVLLLGLSPTYGAATATMAAALLRLLTVAGDGLVFAAGWIARLRILPRFREEPSSFPDPHDPERSQ